MKSDYIENIKRESFALGFRLGSLFGAVSAALLAYWLGWLTVK